MSALWSTAAVASRQWPGVSVQSVSGGGERRWRIGEVVIPPGRPYWNGAVESFHSTLEKELLGREIFQNEQELRAKLAVWQQYYNGRRLHSALGYQTPEERWHQLTLKKFS